MTNQCMIEPTVVKHWSILNSPSASETLITYGQVEMSWSFEQIVSSPSLLLDGNESESRYYID